jgi:hypothetical protein
MRPIREFKSEDPNGGGRRTFLVRLLRGLALGGAGAVGGVLAARGREGLKDQTCDAVGRCRRCRRLADCGLPQAMSARQLEGRP